MSTACRILLLAATAILASEPAAFDQTASFSARVTSIADGDTITVLRDNTPVRVRLFAIDCPERKQPYHARAKEFTANLAFGEIVTVEPRGRDRYARVIGVVRLPDGRVLNSELVRFGLAWWFRKYAPRDRELERLENEARTARRGLWADSEPMAPWEWRQHVRRVSLSTPT
jgi:endonuclease YncB( thermonuclease family)